VSNTPHYRLCVGICD